MHRLVSLALLGAACATAPDLSADPSQGEAAPLPPPVGALNLRAPAVAVEGLTLAVAVDGAPSGARVALFATGDLTAPRDCPPQIAPECLAVGNARLIGLATANGAGVATFEVVLPDDLPPADIALQAAARDGLVYLSQREALPVERTCAGPFTGAAPIPYTELLVGSYGTGGYQLPFDWYGGERAFTIRNAARYADLQAALQVTLPPVDFSTSQVLASTYGVTSSCFVDIVDYDVRAHPVTGEPVMLSEFYDDSAGCPFACDALGDAVIVLEVPRSTAAATCTTVAAGCP